MRRVRARRAEGMPKTRRGTRVFWGIVEARFRRVGGMLREVDDVEVGEMR